MTTTFDPFTADLPVSQWPTSTSEVDRVGELLAAIKSLPREQIARLADEIQCELQDTDPQWLAYVESLAPTGEYMPW